VIAPDYVEALEAWRAWAVVEEPEGFRLRSLFFPILWPARGELAAECLCRPLLPLPRLRRRERHGAPAERCECGVYATTLPRAIDYFRHPGPSLGGALRVLGRVALWGSVVECERGWRASYAYPVVLFVPAVGGRGRSIPGALEAAWGLADYGVPVELVEAARPEELLRVCRRWRSPTAHASPVGDREEER
jgi:hypothetical protein